MEKQIFKTGDKVFIYGISWVVIENVEESCVYVRKNYSEEDNFFIIPNELVSFTEYTLQGNSQERLINYNDYVGKWGKFWNSTDEDFLIGKLKKYDFLNKNHFFFSGKQCYDFFEPLTEEQIEMLELE